MRLTATYRLEISYNQYAEPTASEPITITIKRKQESKGRAAIKWIVSSATLKKALLKAADGIETEEALRITLGSK